MSHTKKALFLLAGVLIASNAYGGVLIISNLAAGPFTGGVDYTAGSMVGTQFTMGASSFNNVSLTIGALAIGNRAVGPMDVTVQLFAGDNAAPSGSALVTIGPTGNYTGAFNTYTYTAPVDFTLNANTTYWLVASSSGDQVGWITLDSSIPNSQPSGPFATAPVGFNRSGSGLPVTLFSNNTNVVYGVSGTEVVAVSQTPEPTTFAMVTLALGAAGMLRRRRT